MHALAFLYICENQGLNVSELADLCRTTCATASRTAHALARSQKRADGGTTPPLVDIRPNPKNPKGRVIFLTPAGSRLCDELDALIADATPIRTPARRAA